MDAQNAINAPLSSPSQAPFFLFKRPENGTPISSLLTPELTASILGVEVKTLAVWRCTKRYPLPWVRVGRNIMYKPEDVQAFIDSRTVFPVEV